MTIEQFGQTIKQKYPAYVNKSDIEVGQAMLKKYPQYQSKIDVGMPTATNTSAQGGGFWSGVGNTALGMAKSIASPVATMIARPFQAGAELLGASENNVDAFSNKYSGGLVAPVPRNFGDVKKDVGRAVQTVALGSVAAPTLAGAAFGFGSSLEQGNKVFSLETAFDTVLGAAAGEVLDLVGKPIFNVAGKVIGKITPEYLQGIASKGANAIKDFAAQHDILPKSVGGVLNTGLKKAENIANAPGTFVRGNVKDVLTSGGQLKEVNKELATQPMARLDIRNNIRDVRFSSKGSLQDMTNTFRETNKTLQTTLADEAKLQAEQNKGTLKTLFQDMSKTYGNGLDQAEKTLVNKGMTINSDDYLDNVVNRTLENAKNYGIPEDNASYKLVQDLQTKFGKEIQTKMKLSDLIRKKNEVYNTLTAGVRKGTAYSSADDLVANSFLRNHGDFIGEMSPELKQLNKEFAPMAQARSWAMKTFRPYDVADIQKGANALTQISGGKVPNQTTLNYLKTLSEGSGQFGGAGDLMGKTTGIGKTIKSNKEVFDTVKQNLISSTDYQINKLQSEMASVQKKGIELGQKADQLKHLKIVRNVIVGITLSAIGGAVLGNTIKKVVAPLSGIIP